MLTRLYTASMAWSINSPMKHYTSRTNIQNWIVCIQWPFSLGHYNTVDSLIAYNCDPIEMY